MGFFKNKYNDIWAGWKILIVLVTFIITFLILNIIISIVYSAIFIIFTGNYDITTVTQMILRDNTFLLINGVIQNLAMIFSVILFWKVFDKKPLKNIGLSSFKHGAKDFVYGLILGAVAISVIFVVFLLSGQITVKNDFLNPNFSWLLLTDLILMIFVGFGEEIFSRGYCMSVLRKSNMYLIFIIPNLIFSLLHISNDFFSFIPLINIFFIGILFSLMFYRRQNIWMPIGYHITWNYFQGSVFGLPVSGYNASGLYTSELIGYNIFNGGGFGPEGGLIVTFLAIVSIVVFYFLTKNKAAESAANLFSKDCNVDCGGDSSHI